MRRYLAYDGAGVRQGIISGAGDFQFNGALQPSALTGQWARGSLGMNPGGTTGAAFTVNRTGVGVYVVTMAADFQFQQPPVIEPSNCYDGVTSFWTNIELPSGGWTNSVRQFTIHCWNNAGAAVDPAADVRNRATFSIEGVDCSGK